VPAPSRKSPLPLGQNQKQTSVRGVGANLSKPVKQNQKRAGV
ncbi:IS110 family transposase, partial [Pseudomonas syringae pv. actinidiae]|nr:IS110 family transposase [Pseudomonas syringae pv. actinidiae]